MIWCFFQAGLYIFQLLDWYIAAFSLPVFGLLECIIFGWIYGILKRSPKSLYQFLFAKYKMYIDERNFIKISHKDMRFQIKIFYLTGADNLSRDIEIMLGRGVPVYMRVMWCIVTPVLLMVRAFQRKK